MSSNTEIPTETTQGAQAAPERRPSTLTVPNHPSFEAHAFRRIVDSEGTAFPWWVIINPKGATKSTAAGLASLFAGPFFSRETADEHLAAHRHSYGKHAIVFCMSGHASPDWRAFCVGSCEHRKPSKPVTLERSDGHVVDFDPWFVKHVHGVRAGTILDERPDLGAVVECVDDSMHLVVGTHRDVAEQVVRARAGL